MKTLILFIITQICIINPALAADSKSTKTTGCVVSVPLVSEILSLIESAKINSDLAKKYIDGAQSNYNDFRGMKRALQPAFQTYTPKTVEYVDKAQFKTLLLKANCDSNPSP